MRVGTPPPVETPDAQQRVDRTTPGTSIRSAAFRASIWTVGGYGATQFVRLVNNIVLSYFLFPSHFGLMALINIFLQGLIMSSDFGIGPSIIQHERGQASKFLNTAWTIQVMRGVVLSVLSILLCWPLAWFYREPQLLQLVPVAAIIPLLDGFTATAVYTVQRTLDVHKLTLLEMASQIIGGIAMCGWAAAFPSVWALVGGTIVSTVVRTAGSHVLLSDHHNRFAWDRDSVRDIVSFGKWILVGTMIAFAALQIDRITLGRLSNMRTLGLYSVALAIAQLPYMVLLRLTYHVQHPILSELQRRSSAELKSRFFHIRGVMLLVAISLTLAVFAAAPLFFRFVYHENFHVAGTIAKLLCLATWGMILSETLTRVLMVKGDSRSLAIYNAVRVLVTVEAVMAGYYLADINGFVFGAALGILCGHLVLQLHMQWHNLSCFRQDGVYTLGFVATAGVIEWVRNFGDAYVPWLGSSVSLLIPLAVGLWAFRRAKRYLRQLATA